MKNKSAAPSEGRETPLSRRKFVQGAASAAGALAVSGAIPGQAQAAVGPNTLWSLVAESIPQTFGDGTTLQIARFRPDAGGPTWGELPLLEAVEGTRVYMRILNNTAHTIRPFIPGVGPVARIRPGTVGGRRFLMPPAGTYMLKSSPGDRISESLGLGAMIVSRPANGQQEVWAGGPTFDREYGLFYQDYDERWITAIQQSTNPDFLDYEPNFFTVNGLIFPDTTTNADTTIDCNVGERVLLRMANLGRMRHSIHFHGYHVQIVDRDNQPELFLPPKDTFGLPRAGTVNAILTPHQPGVYPVHPHSLTAVTSNGLYPFGALALINAV